MKIHHSQTMTTEYAATEKKKNSLKINMTGIEKMPQIKMTPRTDRNSMRTDRTSLQSWDQKDSFKNGLFKDFSSDLKNSKTNLKSSGSINRMTQIMNSELA